MVNEAPTALLQQLDKARAAFEELTDAAQSDRAIAILGFAILDDGLSSLIDSVIVRTSNRAQKDLLSGFLSTPAAKTEMLFRFGILPRLTYEDLTLMRGIRNKFAHSSTPGLGFNSVADLTARLSSVQKMVDFLEPKGFSAYWYKSRLLSPRGLFETHVVLLNQHLSTIQAVVKRRTPPSAPVWA